MFQTRVPNPSPVRRLAPTATPSALRPRTTSIAAAEPPVWRSMAQMLDEVDYGMLLVAADAGVRHVNRCARRELDDSHPLRLVGAAVTAREVADAQALGDAIQGASSRGLRKLLRLGGGSHGVSVAVVPLLAESGEGAHAVLLLLGKRRVCEELTIDWFARSHGLMPAETTVLKSLCADLSPQEVARRQGVELSTVRTQIGSIRTKTGTRSIKALVRQIAMLPPLVGALRDHEPVTAPAPSAFACMVRALHA